MVDVSEIVDEGSFQRWLEALPQGTEAERDEARRWAVLLAHRAAMRVLPGFWAWRLTTPLLKRELTALAVLRLSVTDGVAGKYPTPPIKTAAVAAGAVVAHAVVADADNTYPVYAAVAARTYAFAVPVYADAADAGWKALRTDAEALVAGGDPYLLPLWPAENPLAEQWSTIRAHPSTQSPGWRFWIDWYDRALTGQPQDWALLEKIALIDPKDWDKGTDHVNALILQIIRNHRPPSPKLTPEIRAHLDLVLTLRDPSRQSARFLKGQFEVLEQAYRKKVGCPNETPEELEPIVTLGRAFAQIEWLLTNETDKDRLILQMEAQIAELRVNNAALIAVARGEKASFMRGVFIGALGGTIGGVLTEVITGGASAILAHMSLLGGPATADSLEPLATLLTGPVIDLSPSIPR